MCLKKRAGGCEYLSLPVDMSAQAWLCTCIIYILELKVAYELHPSSHQQIWQFSQAYFIQLSAFFLLDLIYRETDLLLGAWGSFPPATRIFFISLSYLWGTRFVQRLSTVIIFMLTSVLESKQRSPRLWFLIGKYPR